MESEALKRIEERLARIEELLSDQRSDVKKSLMNAEEVAKYTGYAKRYIYNLTRAKKIPHYKRDGKVFFKKEEIDEWLLENRVMSENEVRQAASDYCFRKR